MGNGLFLRMDEHQDPGISGVVNRVYALFHSYIAHIVVG
jgi:hypothetical protein